MVHFVLETGSTVAAQRRFRQAFGRASDTETRLGNYGLSNLMKLVKLQINYHMLIIVDQAVFFYISCCMVV